MLKNFEKGQEVGLVYLSLYSEPKILDGIVIAKGRKILSVQLSNDNFLLNFKEVPTMSDCLGGSYKLFDSKESAEKFIKDKNRKQELITEISSKLSSLSLEKLEKIKNIL